jgi:rubrerythrin
MGGLMVLTLESQTSTQYVRFNGTHQARLPAAEGDILRAYIEFACHYTINDAEMYENAASLAPLGEQKQLFLHLACHKRETLQQLKMNRSTPAVSFTPSRIMGGNSLSRYSMYLKETPLLTLEDAINFGYWRENKTLILYEKLSKPAGHPSIAALFGFLIESQQENLKYLAELVTPVE